MPLNFPNITPSNENFRLLTRSQSYDSSFNGVEQVAELPGSKWSAVLTFANLTKSEVFALRGFLAALRGKAGDFFLTPIDALSPISSPSGSPYVSGAGQTGGELVTEGWGNNQTVRYAGEYFEVNGELKMVIEDCMSDGSGAATLKFSPNLHQSPSNSAPIEYAAPKATMRLANDSQAQWQAEAAEVYAVSFNCIEVIA
jgi:hypothetical protein